MRATENAAREHVLACLSSAPSNGEIIRTAARMARAFNAKFTALFVETPDYAVASAEDKRRLDDNRKLAARLGAVTETVYGEDVPYRIAEFARVSGVTKIVLGQSVVTRRNFFGRPTLTEQLISYAPHTDIYIIPDKNPPVEYHPKKASRTSARDVLKNTVLSALILGAATLAGFFLEYMGFAGDSLIMLYILGVVLISVATAGRVYSLVSAAASVALYNFLFITPRMSFNAYETGYPITFAVMFLTAYITGTLALRYKAQAAQTAKTARRTSILLDTDRLLGAAATRGEIFRAVGEQLHKLLGRRVTVYDCAFGEMSETPLVLPEGGDKGDTDETELAAARWAYEHKHCAGAMTKVFPDAKHIYYAVRINEAVYGVVGIEAGKEPLDAAERGMLLSLLGEGALALENEKNVREKEEAAVLAENERLRANLLRTISHDLRTPLTTISGNAAMLLESGDKLDEETRRGLYRYIRDDAEWLTELVENLLSATRIEDGRMTLKPAAELAEELIDEAVCHVRHEGREISVSAEELLFVTADAKLIVQVLVNLIDNAVKYTPEGSPIAVSAARDGAMARLSVADRGPGIPDDEKARVFDKFYIGSSKVADNRRSLGLGLFLCKAVVEAHGGEIRVKDNENRGAVFEFTLPLAEVNIHE